MASLNLLNNLSRSSICDKPFPHVILHDVFPPDIYKDLSDTFPEELMTHSDHELSPFVVNDRSHTRRLLYRNFKYFPSIAPIWHDFAAAHLSINFFRTVTEFFLEPFLAKLYPGLLSKLPAYDVINRSLSRSDYGHCLTDFQLVGNLPVSDSHISRSPHLDNPQQLYAILFYMRKDDDTSIGGGLDLYNPKTSAFEAPHGRGRSIDPCHLSPFQTLHYQSNTAILFLNTRSSYHSVQPIFDQSTLRRSVNIIGELPPGSKLFSVS